MSRGDGRAAQAIVVGFGDNGRHDLKQVTRVATDDEVRAVIDQAAVEADKWLQIARRVAGLPTSSRARKVPDGYPEIAPIDGKASRTDADAYARMWWRAYKSGQEAGWPAAEIRVVESIARRWFAVRDKGGNL